MNGKKKTLNYLCLFWMVKIKECYKKLPGRKKKSHTIREQEPDFSPSKQPKQRKQKISSKMYEAVVFKIWDIRQLGILIPWETEIRWVPWFYYLEKSSRLWYREGVPRWIPVHFRVKEIQLSLVTSRQLEYYRGKNGPESELSRYAKIPLPSLNPNCLTKYWSVHSHVR